MVCIQGGQKFPPLQEVPQLLCRRPLLSWDLPAEPDPHRQAVDSAHEARDPAGVFRWRLARGATQNADHIDTAVKKLEHTLADSRYTSYFKAPQAGVSYKGHCKPEEKAAGCISDDDVRASDSYYERIWSEYATSEFSWQPSGDTPTRRGYASDIRARTQTACTAYAPRNFCQH